MLAIEILLLILHNFSIETVNMSSASRLIFTLLVLLLCISPIGLCAAGKDFVVVVDAGHGGKDAGALGVNTTEKAVNLNVALELAEVFKRNMPDAKVYLTRSTDRFLTLQERPDFANRKKADIFISIHANSVDLNSPGRTSVQGASVYTLGLRGLETNLNVAMRENAVMKLEDDYSTTYQGFNPSLTESYIAFEMLQQKHMAQSISLAEAVQKQLVKVAGRKNGGVKQAPFWVLVRTGMPAILVELDFICNPVCENFMASRAGVSKLAHAIYGGVEQYRYGKVRTPYRQSAKNETPAEAPADSIPAALQAVTEDKNKENSTPQNSSAQQNIIYKVQFLASPRVLPEGDKRLKGLSPVEYYKDGSTVKYTYGAFSTQAEAMGALKMVRALFGDAFVIKTVDGQRVK